MEPVPPIIADENGDVHLFESLRDAEEYVEPVDVENDEYNFYDSTGLVLKGEVHTDNLEDGLLRRLVSPSWQRVRLVVGPETDRRPDELAEVLRSLLATVGPGRTGIDDEALSDMTLDQLVSATVGILR
jgi:hypothetical protein